jgi:hypothetical protein
VTAASQMSLAIAPSLVTLLSGCQVTIFEEKIVVRRGLVVETCIITNAYLHHEKPFLRIAWVVRFVEPLASHLLRIATTYGFGKEKVMGSNIHARY